jgi:hypothetical protein
MNTLWQVPVVVAALLTWLSTPPESFADAADREALRRQLTGKATHVYTNLDLPAAPYPRESSAGTGIEPSATTNPGAKTDETLSAPVQVRDEAWWRARVASLRQTADHNEMLGKAMQLKVNTLTADMVSRDDPFQRRELRDQLQKALAELERLQTAELEARKSLEGLQEEARRAGAPPGWLR